jgi:hypothetical protein
MLFSFRSSKWSWALITALVAAWREVRAERRASRVAFKRGLAALKPGPGRGLLEIGGDPAGLASPAEFGAGDGA